MHSCLKYPPRVGLGLSLLQKEFVHPPRIVQGNRCCSLSNPAADLRGGEAVHRTDRHVLVLLHAARPHREDCMTAPDDILLFRQRDMGVELQRGKDFTIQTIVIHRNSLLEFFVIHSPAVLDAVRRPVVGDFRKASADLRRNCRRV